MTLEQKLNKLIDYLTEYAQDWQHFSDPNQRLFLNNLFCKLKELKTDEIRPPTAKEFKEDLKKLSGAKDDMPTTGYTTTRKEWEDLREILLRDYTEFYFIHCKPEQRPEFKKIDEAENWYKHQEFKINSIVRNQVDNLAMKLQQTIDQKVSRAVEEFAQKVDEKVIGKDQPMPHDPNFDVVTYDSRISPLNQLRAKQRIALKLLVKSTK